MVDDVEINTEKLFIDGEVGSFNDRLGGEDGLIAFNANFAIVFSSEEHASGTGNRS